MIVQLGSPLCVKCSPCASAGTAAKAVTSSDSTAIMPNFLNIKVFLLYLVGLYCSLRTGACLRHCLRAVECLFAGAGRSCVCPYVGKQASGPLSFRFLRKLPWPHHLLSLLALPFPKQKPAIIGSQ